MQQRIRVLLLPLHSRHMPRAAAVAVPLLLLSIVDCPTVLAVAPGPDDLRAGRAGHRRAAQFARHGQQESALCRSVALFLRNDAGEVGGRHAGGARAHL